MEFAQLMTETDELPLGTGVGFVSRRGKALSQIGDALLL